MQKLMIKLGDHMVKEHVIDTEVVTVGRARDNEVMIENLSVSRNHARIRREDGRFVLIDLNSANGTFVNGVRINKTELVDGDIISIGKHRLHFIDTDSAAGREALARVAADLNSPTGEPQVPAPEPVKAAPVPEIPTTPAPFEPDDESRRVAAAIMEGTLAAALIVKRGKQQGHVFALEGNETTIGRHGTDVRLHDWHVGKRHAVITFEQGIFAVRDLGSWQGTVVNGEKVKQGRLHKGDEMIFGGTQLEFHLGSPEEIQAMLPKNPETIDFSGEALSESPGQESDELPVTEPPMIPVEGFSDEDASADDEFAPMTDEELAALDDEADALFSQSDELSRQAEWEQIEAEKLLAEGGGLDIQRGGVLIEQEEELAREEEKAVREAEGHELLDDPELSSGQSVEQEDEEEEDGLFGGPIPDSESALDAAGPGRRSLTPPPADASPAVAVQSPVATTSVVDEIAVPEGVDPREFRRWSRGLKNRSKIVRREAARKLKDLTGIDYDWESDPE